MDVNISPAGAQTLRLEGNISDRLDVDGQSFEMFLNISETLSNPVVDPGPQPMERHKTASDERRESREESDALDVRDDTSRGERMTQRSDDDRDDEASRRDAAQEMAHLMGQSNSRREILKKNASQRSDEMKETDTTDEVDTESMDEKAHVSHADSDSRPASNEPDASEHTDQSQSLKVEAVDTDALAMADHDESVSLSKVDLESKTELKEMTKVVQKWDRDSSDDLQSQTELVDEAVQQTLEDSAMMDEMPDTEVQDWQLLRPKSQEAKKGTGQFQGINGQSDSLVDSLSEFAPEDSRFLDEPMSDAVDVQMNEMDGELEVHQKQQQIQPKGAEAEWSRLLREGVQNGEKSDRSGALKSDIGKLAGLKSGTASASTGLRTGVGVAAPNQSVSKPTIASETKQASAPTRASLPEGVDELSILRQVSDGLRLKAGRTQRAEIRLNPQELGTVQIKMEMSGDSVKIVVSAEHAGVGDLLNNGLDQLKKDLLAQGLHIEDVEIRNELTDGHDQDGQSQDGRDDDHESERTEVSDGPITRHHSGRLNVRA